MTERAPGDAKEKLEAGSRPLSALLSQVLVAFTVELDGEFERLMRESGYAGGLSLVVWLNLVRFLTSEELSVRTLANRCRLGKEGIAGLLGCLERWRFIEFSAGEGSAVIWSQGERGKRAGWGSGRGILADWPVALTAKGRRAAQIWPPLLPEIEQRWQARFGAVRLRLLRKTLQAIVEEFDVEWPHGLTPAEPVPGAADMPPRRVPFNSEGLPLPVLLSQVLQAFAHDFNLRSKTPLALSANALRVLGVKPVPESDISRLTGSSSETSGVGWQLRPYIAISAHSAAKRGKAVRLNQRGLQAQRNYYRLTAQVERDWEDRFSAERVRSLRESLLELFREDREGRPLLAAGLVPPPGTTRSGAPAPALGRKRVAAAARQRARQMVAQSEQYQRDPDAALPHFPLWDINRGFGP
jgi:hypothetical protein